MGPPAYVPGEVLVKFRDGAGARRAHGRLGARVVHRVAPLGLERVELPPGLSVEAALASYGNDPAVEYAEPNYLVVKATAPPNDPLYRSGDQWPLERISAPGAWERATGGDVVVAILDTGIDYAHPDLVANLWVNPGEVPGNGRDDDGNGVIDDVFGVRYKNGIASGDPLDDDTADTHGTHLAGVIGAVGDNGLGVTGVNWRVRLMAVKFLHGAAGLGNVADAATGILYAVDHGARVLNLSFTIPASDSLQKEIRSLEDALAYADAHGVLAVSAAGNSRRDLDRSKVYPASTRTANNIVVAATTREDGLSSYSNFGRTAVDVAAPGGAQSNHPSGVLSTRGAMAWSPGTGYGTLSGTSVATPHVAGLAALVWSQRPGLTHHQVKARILNGADRIAALENVVLAGGRINAAATLAGPDLPCVFDASPRRVNPGQSVVLTGVNFGSGPGRVEIGPAILEVLSWGARRIEARVPTGAASGRVQVNGAGTGFSLDVNLAPEVRLELDVAVGPAPLGVTARAAASDPDGTVAAYEWDLGDGEFRSRPGVAETVAVTLERPGLYTLRVRVRDGEGLATTASATVEVRREQEPLADVGHGCFLGVLGRLNFFR